MHSSPPPPPPPPPPSRFASSSSALVPFCYSLNYVLGVGVLSLPHGFAASGWLLGTAVAAVVGWFSWAAVNWVLEVMARAEAVVTRAAHTPLLRAAAHPPHLSHIATRKFEFSALCRIFLGRRWERVYMFFFVMNFVAALWSLGIVFASAMASNVALPWVNAGAVCDVEVDSSAGCQNAYLMHLAMFAPAAVFLSCLELREQVNLQVFLSALRFAVTTAMMATSVVGMFTQPPPTLSDAASLPGPPFLNGRKAWDASGIVSLVPLVLYANILSHSVPGISHTLVDKRPLRCVFQCVFMTIFVMYALLSSIVALYYGDTVDEVCTLTWRHGRTNSVLSSLILLFPAVDAFSCYPLMGITYGNNLMSLVLRKPNEASRLTTILFRQIAVLPPLIGAVFIRNIDTILSWCGLFSLQIAFVFPCALQFFSSRRCRKLFGINGHCTEYSGRFSGNWSILSALAFSAVSFVFILISSIRDV